jgi:conserved oligomeric Golgi complex subunit 6
MSSNLDTLGLPHRDRPDVGSRSVSGSAAAPKSSTALTSKVATILSTSYSDAEFRDALALLDERGVKNDPETRRQLRLDLQKEVIDSNSSVIAEFGKIAEVRLVYTDV